MSIKSNDVIIIVSYIKGITSTIIQCVYSFVSTARTVLYLIITALFEPTTS